MKPIHEAVELIQAHGDDFDSQFRFHLNSGWVYSGEDCFVMATTPKLVELDLSDADLIRFSLNTLDNRCWYIYVYAGNLKRVLELIPFRLEQVAFRRYGGKVRVYEMEKLIRRIER